MFSENIEVLNKNSGHFWNSCGWSTKSTSRVSGLNRTPTKTATAPIMILNANKYGICCSSIENKSIAIIGAHAPIISPALYEKIDALFLILVGKRSDKNAGIKLQRIKNFQKLIQQLFAIS
jgi:hypothetical protein